MDSLKGFLAALAGIGARSAARSFVIVAALVIIGLFFTGIFAMIGLSITMLAIAIEVGLATSSVHHPLHRSARARLALRCDAHRLARRLLPPQYGGRRHRCRRRSLDLVRVTVQCPGS